MKKHDIFTGIALLLSACLLTQCATQPNAQTRANLHSATKASPFVNSLGMKFVPVPGTNLLMCTTETTMAQYQASGLKQRTSILNQGKNYPATLSWDDAKKWCAWLSRREGLKYRLPRDAEWSMAVGSSLYPWGNVWPPPNNCGNYGGEELLACTESELKNFNSPLNPIAGFRDLHKFAAPVGSYPANKYGLHDLGGNLWEWCEDSDPKMPTYRILRGGSWGIFGRNLLTSGYRYSLPPIYRNDCYGFRCVVER